MACGDFSLWYNLTNKDGPSFELWLAGTSRYGTI